MQDPVRFGRYILERRLAVGGMAEVFLARVEGPRGFEKRVVLKRILPNLVGQERYVEMFLDEARIAAHFNHPNVVQVYELTEVQGQYCLVMEYIEGEDLATVLDACEEKGLLVPVEIASFIIAEAAEGLHYVHNLKDETGEPLNVVHRDVSPANVIVTRNGPIKVVDFGIAKHSVSSSHTQTGVLKGKYSYMSPEQVRGKNLDPRSDIFSLGTVFYELLTVTRCFTRDNPYATLDAVSRADCKPLRELRPDIPPDVGNVVDRMLQKDRRLRFDTAADVSTALRRFLSTRVLPTVHDLNALLDEMLDLIEPTEPVPRMHLSTLGVESVVPVPKELARPEAMVDEHTHQFLLEELLGEDTYSGNWSGLEAGGDPTPYSSAMTMLEDIRDWAAGFWIDFGDKWNLFKERTAEGLVNRPWLPAGIILGIGMIVVIVLYQRAVSLREEQLTLATERRAAAAQRSETPTVEASSSEAEDANATDASASGGDPTPPGPVEASQDEPQEEDVEATTPEDNGDAPSTGPPAEKEGTTEVLLKSEPAGAEVHLDGEPLNDSTPLVLHFAPGEEHEVILEKDGFITTRKIIEVEEETHQKVFVELPPAQERGKPTEPKRSRAGFLSVTSDPRAEVLIKGKRIGFTPIKRQSLNEGAYTMVLRHSSGATKSLRVSIASGKLTSRHVPFKKGRVVIQVRPWAHVYLGKKKLGTTPMPPFKLYEGVHQLRLVNPERGERSIKVTVKPGETTKIAEEL